MRRTSLALMLLSIPVSAHPDCEQDEHVQAFLNQLTGDWRGEAVTTPVGPRPYDISFDRRGDYWIYGHADPGAAIHHWGFYCDGGELWLRFLSTFRGNRDPVLLEAITITGMDVHFKANNPAFLEVKVKPGDRQSRFEVLHHGERHVLIELTRATQ